jgi:outer membrane immunogenic protein
MKAGILSSIAVLALCGVSRAADLPASYSKAPVGPTYNWSGFYVGAMGGYTWSDKFSATLGSFTLTSTSSALKGGFAGGTLGYNFQSGNIVVGFEADAAWADVKNPNLFLAGITLADKINAFGSVTGRVGLALDAALFYAKGGYAWANNQISIPAFDGAISESHLHSGWTAGAGAEYLFTPAWSAKVEYMYADYGSKAYLSSFVTDGVGLAGTTHSAKFGLNYHLR